MVGEIESEPRWLDIDIVLFAQAKTIAAHGGATGVRDRGAILSALSRPIDKLHYDRARITLFDLAAAYGYGLCRNHGFVDGNKRIAALSMYVFLGLNGFRLDARDRDLYAQIMALADGTLQEEALAEWLKANSYRADQA